MHIVRRIGRKSEEDGRKQASTAVLYFDAILTLLLGKKHVNERLTSLILARG